MLQSIVPVLLGIAAGATGMVVLSFAIEALRSRPTPPRRLPWAPDIEIEYLHTSAGRIRYIKTGQGPTLVLLHTLRTQLDLFEKLVPDLAKDFTVYALDFPGRGYSDIPRGSYDATFFTGAVESFLDSLDLQNVTLAGVSIGASIGLIIASHRNPRVLKVVAINPYDYAKGRGLARSSWLARLLLAAARVPVFGETVMRLRSFPIIKAVFDGGMADPRRMPPRLLKEMYRVGNRPGHYRAFLSLLRNSESWELATKDYVNIKIPVLLVWGKQDWARTDEMEHDRQIIPGARMVIVDDGGHFLPLDRPDAVIERLRALKVTPTNSAV